MIDNAVVRYAVYDTGVGNVTVIALGRKLISLTFGAFDPEGARNEENSALYDSIIELNQYCFGQRKEFDLRLQYEGSEEEKIVWEYCRTLRYGETKTIGEASKETGIKENLILYCLLRNPLPIFIPTHRILSNKGESICFPSANLPIADKLLAIERGETRRVYSDPSTEEKE